MTTKSIILNALINSERPTYYLAHIGLSYDDYSTSDNMTMAEKITFVNKLIAQANTKNIQKIIHHLALLEFSRDSHQVCLRKESLLGQLIEQYIIKQEQERFKKFAEKWNIFSIDKRIRSMAYIIESAASTELIEKKEEQQSFQELGNIILDSYSRLIPTDSANIKTRLVESGFLDLFNESDEEENNDLKSEDLSDEDDVELGDIDIKNMLKRLEQNIREIKWEVGSYLLFQGGVNNAGQRVPHRVNDILNIIKKCKHGETDPNAAWRELIKTAKIALDNPRPGRKQSTTEFYAGMCKALDDSPETKETSENQKNLKNRRV